VLACVPVDRPTGAGIWVGGGGEDRGVAVVANAGVCPS